MRRFLALLILVLLAGCETPRLDKFLDYPGQPSFLQEQAAQKTARAEQKPVLKQADLDFLEWIQKPGAKDFYIWRESQRRTIPQPELDFLQWIVTPGAKEYFIAQHDVQSAFVVLKNDKIELHLNLEHGGSIVHLGPVGGKNYVNNHDKGRQIQQSYYAGKDRTYPDQHPSWKPWPWNPIQSGDVYDNPGELISVTSSATYARVVTKPKRWDRKNAACDCTMTTTVRLAGNVVQYQAQIVIGKGADIQGPMPRHQEVPALYFVGALDRLMTYVGDRPCQGQPLTRITRKPLPHAPTFPWNYWPHDLYPGKTTEKWAAAVDGTNTGVGVYMSAVELWIGGHVGGTSWNTRSADTTYISPLQTRTLKPGDRMSYKADFVVGSLSQIRFHACGVH